MKTIAILSVLLLTGCDFKVYQYEIEGYAKACEKHGGVVYVDNIVRAAKCKDGKYVEWEFINTP